ncbi:MAG: signal peptide peptidase SppA [Acidobacteriota bacterium]|nr:signal peptide peptidase SppA [Acidobacteriota bacterium]
MSKTGKTLLIIGGVLLALLLFSIIGLVLIAESIGKPDIPENSVLVLKVSGDLPDYAPQDPMAALIGVEQEQSFSSLLMQLRKAKVDKRVGAVFLDIGFSEIGWGKADELRSAIKDFRKSGKPIYAYTELGLNKEYYIAAAADKVFMPPTGDIYVNGLAAEVMFFRGSLDKLGVFPEFIKIGKYKNAPNQFTEKELTEAHREVVNSLVDDQFNRLISTIAADRKLAPETVKEIIDNAPHNGVNAKKLGLIDDAFYRDEIDNELKKKLGYKAEDELRKVAVSQYKEVRADTLGLNDGERVAVIYASGGINTGKSTSSPVSGDSLGADTIVEAINDAAEDETIKAIVLRVDSPGGSALASDLMWHSIENAKKKKPFVVSMGDVAASGGYYIACNANKIVAEPSTITGSIGVFMGKPVVKDFYDWLGISNEYVMRGKNAGLFRETEKWTDEERAKFQEQANNIYYSNFVPKVAKGRNMSEEKVDSLGQGRVWTGQQAKANGLIDEFGGLEKAIDIAKDLAKLPADKDVKRVVMPQGQTLFDRLLGRGDDTTFTKTEEQIAQEAVIKALPEDVRRSLRYAELFDKMKRGETMMLMPFEIRMK